MPYLWNDPLYTLFNGIRIPALFSPKCVKEALEYKPQTDDNFIITYPKCGTTWMQNVVISIFRKGVPLEECNQFRILSPFIEMVGLEGVRKMPRPGAIKSHLPYTHMPYSPDAKYIFVVRNPRDTCVSLYHHTRTTYGFGYIDGLFDDFFELFMDGKVEYNDYFDHLMSWYPHRNDRNVWYTTYEQMKADPESVILKLAKFLGQEYADAIERDNAVMRSIINVTSFEYMKKNINSSSDEADKFDLEAFLKNPTIYEGVKYMARFTADLGLPKELPKAEFVRKGIVGDWKNHLSLEQIERLHTRFAEKTKGTDLDAWWTF